MPEKAVLVAPKVSTESKMSTQQNDTSSTNDADVILSKAECDALEKLFDRLVDSRCSDFSTLQRSVTESSIGSTVDNVDNDVENDAGVQGDESSDEDETTETESVEKSLKTKIKSKNDWVNKRATPATTSPSITTSKDDTSIVEKVRRKRKRNRTIDYADLPNGGDTWCGKVAGYSQRKFEQEPVFSTELSKVKSFAKSKLLKWPLHRRTYRTYVAYQRLK